MKLFRKNLLHRKSSSILSLLFFSLVFYCCNSVFSSQENYLKEVEFNNITKEGDETKSAIPTNPFELVDMLRKANSMNDATSPSDAIDNALRSFDNLKLKDN